MVLNRESTGSNPRISNGWDGAAMAERHWPSTQNRNDSGASERAQSDSLRRVPLSRILGSDREIVIEFNGADYRLRITRNQKLILTK
jgi:hemin uptake protein HemP